ncbi:MAG: cbb3-type cytochrome oxidase assembly protein CcoS [Xanthomonadales bacterium]|nr:cbb3-type cytochrome oxidase assembly protein CcoS [Xanthomonadales bacterium]
MSMLAILIPLGLVLVVIAVMILLWAVRDGQFEDLESPAWQIVLDDDASPEAQKTTKPPS